MLLRLNYGQSQLQCYTNQNKRMFTLTRISWYYLLRKSNGFKRHSL